MDVEKALYLRQNVERLGIAPLTSMYWYSETAKPMAVDWRPELVHDRVDTADRIALEWAGPGR